LGNTAALDQLLLKGYGGQVGRGLDLELQRVRNLPDVWKLYLARSSPISERTVRVVKFCRNRENIRGGHVFVIGGRVDRRQTNRGGPEPEYEETDLWNEGGRGKL
jgi:hypothetical protein